jgi:predicted hotdog family 3-hydroxylacyl-ACP dehydratase
MNFPPIEELLLHRGTMLLIDRVLDFDQKVVVVEYSPRRDAWYVDARGNMPAWIGLELMAQTIAVHVSLSKRMQGLQVQLGVLLGTRRFETKTASFAAHSLLHIEAKPLMQDESGLGAYECRILTPDQILAEATLKVYEPEDPAQFLRMQELTS